MSLKGFPLLPQRTTYFDGHFINWFRPDWIKKPSLVPFLDATFTDDKAKIIFMNTAKKHVVADLKSGIRGAGIPCMFPLKNFDKVETQVVAVYRAWLAQGGKP
ncbi:hypothetical protein [Rhizobium sp. 2MFCol3.1]|uniref:hypothetical protein n=1 Tax=Rhizobium sp. 2MFCol3.1 TaxID=1246459 RepID=UPI000364F74D|nr:hypothetical protein [Rhizobium sp. 2MFCol3.1]